MIDWTRITELQDEIGKEDFADVVEIFLEEVSEVVDDLRTIKDRSNLEDQMHFLKGSALNLGFQAMSVHCQDGERMSASGQADEVNLDQVISCFEESRQVFLRDINNHQ